MQEKTKKTTSIRSWILKLGMWLAAAGISWIFPYVFMDEPQETLTALILFGAAVQMGFFEKCPISPRRAWGKFIPIGLGLGLLLAAWNLSIPGSTVSSLPWEPATLQGVTEAAEKGDWVLIDFYADWCMPCKRLESHVFSNEEVGRELGRFRLFKADLTRGDDKEANALAEKHAVQGLPTIVFIDPSGRERTRMRLLGYEPASRFLSRLQAVR